MEELALFSKYINSSFKNALNGKVVITPFINQNQINTINRIKKDYDLNVFYDGGFINSEYFRCVITPYDYPDFKINVFKIEYNKKYYSLTHKQILGTLMSLGIKRECVGDIYICDNNAYFAVTEEITPFILNEFKYVGKCPIELKEIDYKVTMTKKTSLKKLFISSLRLDVLISNVYNLSRKETLDIILNGDVKLNYDGILNPNKVVEVSDLISVRHFGRFSLNEVIGKSRSEHLIVNVEIYE